MTHAPGKGSKYQSIRRLGTDGPFVVEVALPQEQRGVQQAVLLKRLRPGWPVSSQALSQFLDDSQSASGSAHPNIVQVLDVSEDESGPILVTEYIHGVTLAAALRQIRSGDQSLVLSHALTIVQQACAGLQAAQVAGQAGRSLIHGAISPEHLMITFEGLVKCKDFGIFRLYPLDQRDSLGGPNPAYLSPEQEQGLQPNIQSDLFSLGKVFKKLLSYTPEGSANQLPPELIQILSKLLTADPAGRTQSAAVLKNDLEEPVRIHGFGNAKTDRMQLGTFVREMFGSKSAQPADANARPGKTTREKAPASDSVGLLDPSAFWKGGDSDTRTVEAEDVAEDEPSGEAVVISTPAGRPNELFLPDSERIVDRPRPVSRPPTAPAPPIPQEDFLKVGKTRSTRFAAAGVAAGLCLLAGILIWTLSGAGSETETAETVSANPAWSRGAVPALKNPAEKITAGEEPRTPPPPRSRTGILKLNSNPPGALVYINDEKKGVTPLTVKDALVGTEVSVRIELEGHRTWNQTVQFDEDNPVREFTAGLLKDEVCEFGTGWIYVTTDPEGGTVEMDGKRLPGKTPTIINDVCAGVEHEIRVQAVGFRTWSKVVTVQPRNVLNLNVELEH